MQRLASLVEMQSEEGAAIVLLYCTRAAEASRSRLAPSYTGGAICDTSQYMTPTVWRGP